MLLRLFATFFKIGLFTFGGGMAMIPLIRQEIIERQHWIEKGDFLDMLAVAQSAPGPIALNTAVFIGYKVKGFWGALAAVAGVVIPSFVVILAVAILFAEVRDNKVVDAAFKAMRPAVVALIVAPIIGLAKGMRWYMIAIAATVAMVVWYWGVSPIYLIATAIVTGVVYTIIRTRKERKK